MATETLGEGLTAEQLQKKIEGGHAYPYDLTDERQLMRLMREVRGYLHTCHGKHGTDWEGRNYAMAALDKIITGEIGVKTY